MERILTRNFKGRRSNPLKESCKIVINATLINDKFAKKINLF